jgi:hypothetical protein
VDRNCRLAAHSPLPHILDVLQGALELARQERLLEAHAVIEQQFEPTFLQSISKSKKLGGEKSGHCFKTKRININWKSMSCFESGSTFAKY